MLLNPALNQERITENLACPLPDKFLLVQLNCLVKHIIWLSQYNIGYKCEQAKMFPYVNSGTSD